MLRLTVSSILRREKELIRFGSSLAISQRGLTDGMHQAEGTRSPGRLDVDDDVTGLWFTTQ